VTRAVLHALSHTGTVGQTLELTGPEVFTLRQLVEQVGEVIDKPRPVLGLPRALAYFQALGMQCLPGEPLMSTDNLSSMEVDNVASPAQSGQLSLLDWGITPASLQAVLPTYLGRVTGGDGPRNRLLAFRSSGR